MANKIGEVLEIKPEDSYIKKPAGPMITMETRDIGKLTGYIHIPSMVEGATVKDTTLQRILYSSLPNQCQKCCQFEHFAQTCIMTRIPIWNASPHANTPTMWSERVAWGPTDTSTIQSASHSQRNERKQRNWNKQSSKEIEPPSQTEGDQTKQSAPTKTGKDQEMGELLASPTHQVANNLNVIPSEVVTQIEGIHGCNTFKVKLSFNIPGEKNDSTQGKWANLNPFEALNGENESSNFLRKISEELKGGWTF
jgi:hypothetical protein